MGWRNSKTDTHQCKEVALFTRKGTRQGGDMVICTQRGSQA